MMPSMRRRPGLAFALSFLLALPMASDAATALHVVDDHEHRHQPPGGATAGSVLDGDLDVVETPDHRHQLAPTGPAARLSAPPDQHAPGLALAAPAAADAGR